MTQTELPNMSQFKINHILTQEVRKRGVGQKMAPAWESLGLDKIAENRRLRGRK